MQFLIGLIIGLTISGVAVAQFYDRTGMPGHLTPQQQQQIYNLQQQLNTLTPNPQLFITPGEEHPC